MRYRIPRMPWVEHPGPASNGAAPARARNEILSMRGVGFTMMLQRGRARAGAECEPVLCNVSNTNPASTGPRPRGRGMAAGDDKLLLERAASTGPRPRGRGMSGSITPGNVPAFASTGPRPRGRGMQEHAKLGNLRWWLQRGRARAGAECPYGLRGPRKILPASTGPRPRGRGMGRRRRLAQGPRVASTGPRPRGRGMSVSDRVATLEEREASTGPRPRGRGMLL